MYYELNDKCGEFEGKDFFSTDKENQLLYQYNQAIYKLTTVRIRFYWTDGVWGEWQISSELIKLKKSDVRWVAG